jgi:hypothetical protein
LSREHAAFVARGDALDGGGDAFVPGHSGDRLEGRGSRVELRKGVIANYSFNIMHLKLAEPKSSKNQGPSSRETSSSKLQASSWEKESLQITHLTLCISHWSWRTALPIKNLQCSICNE